jgi:hypothetical protein
MTRNTICAAAAALALTLAGLGGQPALGQATTPTARAAPASKLVFVGASTTRTEGQVMLTARLTTADGRPLSGQSIDFYQRVELFGSRLAHLGAATTDSSGAAALLYLPAEVGRQEIAARFDPEEGYAPSEATGAIDVGAATPPFESDPLPLALVSHWLPYALGAMVIATWVVLLWVFLSTARGIKAAVPAALPSRRPTPAATTSSRRAGGDA